ncbi:hypothetical protein SAMN05421505_120139 [Sinosporangium album]|uniref:Uncharacterized protein n=1 Tax=Sinosporangium album TaxID=504805 RepID=A0A1G8EKJ0_9ACTN|nr:hypothetical protein [Sinosporangium album]SDH70376.1 hypothetical protein SAMN05421505_120139 [Sinosporangium album]
MTTTQALITGGFFATFIAVFALCLWTTSRLIDHGMHVIGAIVGLMAFPAYFLLAIPFGALLNATKPPKPGPAAPPSPASVTVEMDIPDPPTEAACRQAIQDRHAAGQIPEGTPIVARCH